MEAKECKRFDECSAPICPLDKGSMSDAVWYPDEEICQLRCFCNEPWIRTQKKIASRCQDTSGYFTLIMLEHPCIIGRGIVGLDPDVEDESKEQQLERWFSKHPVKKIMSAERKEFIKNIGKTYRQDNVPSEKYQSVEENQDLEDISSMEL